MGRWEPDARGRLERAAMELYVERGYESTTVADIAERAGLTERTFFRHYSDKREVLFAGTSLLQEVLATRLADAVHSVAPMEAVLVALDAAAEMIQGRGEWSKKRQAVIDANPELKERELVKLASLSSAMAQSLRASGVEDPAATLCAEAGMTAFKVGFERWVRHPRKHDLRQLVRSSFDDLTAVTSRR